MHFIDFKFIRFRFNDFHNILMNYYSIYMLIINDINHIKKNGTVIFIEFCHKKVKILRICILSKFFD